MTKNEFLEALKLKLSRLPKQELNDRLNFYSEMIDDGIEDGLTEEEAVSKIGSVEDIALEIVGNIPLSKITKEIFKPKRKLSGLDITLLIVGFPIWFTLLASVFVVVVSLYASLWAVVISLWAGFAFLLACGVAGVIFGAVYIIQGLGVSGIWLIGGALVSLGLSIFAFFICKYFTKYSALAIPKTILGIKKLILKKEKCDE